MGPKDVGASRASVNAVGGTLSTEELALIKAPAQDCVLSLRKNQLLKFATQSCVSSKVKEARTHLL